jgi:hypothetical protein
MHFRCAATGAATAIQAARNTPGFVAVVEQRRECCLVASVSWHDGIITLRDVGCARPIDFEPVVKIFTPDGNATRLLTELDPIGEHLAFGLCDLGLGEPELGYVSACTTWLPPSGRSVRR